MEWLVNVVVHQAANLTLGGETSDMPSPSVVVSCFDIKHETNTVSESATCSFGHSFTFTKHLREDDFMSGDIEILVNHYKGFGMKRTLGHVVFSVKKVYSQTNHSVPKGWFQVTQVGQPAVNVGFVQLSVGAYSSDDTVPRSLGGSAGETEGATIKSRVIQTPVSKKVKSLYQLTVRVHKAEDLPEQSGLLSTSCDPCVQIDFLGTSQCTKKHHGKTSPLFNEEIRVPFMVPCWDDSISVMLKNRPGMGSEVELGRLTLDLDKLLTKEMQPTWFNFYAVDDEAASSGFAGIFGGSGETEESVYAGRLLLSACAERSETPILRVGNAPPANDPPALKSVVWVDFYEVLIEAEQEVQSTYCTVSSGKNLEEIRSEEPERKRHSFMWNDETGRLPEQSVALPLNEMCADMIISVWAEFKGWMQNSWVRQMFVRIPMTEICSQDVGNNAPKWYEGLIVTATSGPKNGGFLLACVRIGLENQMPRRPDRLQITPVTFRFKVKIHQATGLPFKHGNKGSSPFLAILFGDATLRTDTIPESMNPVWNQVLEAEVSVPRRTWLRPDILVYVLDTNEDGAVEPLAMLRYSTSTEGALPEKWTDPPAWFDLQPAPGGVEYVTGRVLLAFELTPVDENTPPVVEVQPIEIDTKDCKVEIFAVGARMWEPDLVSKDSILLFGWGRQEEDRSSPVKEKGIAGASLKGCDIDFRQSVSLRCKLATDSLSQEFLEVKLLGDRGDGELGVVAFANIHLQPYLPWISDEKRRKLEEEFGDDEEVHKTSSEINRIARGSLLVMDLDDVLADREKAFCRSIGWNVDSIEHSNIRDLGTFEYISLTEEDSKKCKKANAVRASQLRKSVEDAGALTDVPEFAGIMADFAEAFEWPYEKGGDDVLHKHPDLDCPLEDGVLEEQPLPFACARLYVGSEWGEPKQVGVLKLCIRVIEKSRPRNETAEEEDRKWKENIDEIQRELDEADDIVIRAYILSADGLTPDSGSSDISSFVCSRVEMGKERTSMTYYDNVTVRHHTTNPKFHSCHTFSHVTFPGCCTMQFNVYEQTQPGLLTSGGHETLIGSTLLDLEDRWFRRRYREMVSTGVVPIECRSLGEENSCFSKGNLRLWVDIMTADDSHKLPIEKLPSIDPLQFQLRVVIWKVKGIDACFPDGSVPDIYVTAKHILDNHTELQEQTDTHYGADDGMGTFNWRFVFDIFVPCLDPKLQLRVWNDNMMSDDSLAEVTLDLGRDFYVARKTDSAVELPRGTIRLTHPAFPGDTRCELDLEAVVLPMTDALTSPAGKGREAPNIDPFLDPEDAHLKAHRSYLANLSIVKNVGKLGGGLFTMGKYLVILYAVVGIVGGLIFSGLTLYMMMK